MKKSTITLFILMIAFLPFHGQVNLTHGLIGYWPFDNHANDASGKNQHGTLVGDAGYSTGIIGQCLDLDGFGDYVNVTQGVNLNSPEVTVSVWVYLNNLNLTFPPILTKRVTHSNSPSYWFGLKYGNPLIALYDQSWTQFTLTSSSSINPSNWVHLVYTGCSQKMDIYIDGRHSGTNTGPNTIFNSAAWVRIGSQNDQPDPDITFNGKIDELRIYSRCLNQSEIDSLYCQGKPPVGIPESLSINMPLIAPTISNGLFYLKNNHEAVKTSIRIHNIHGELIYANEFMLGRAANEIDLQYQARGVYFVEFTTKKHSAIQKIVIR